MALIDQAVDGLFGAVITGLTGSVAIWLGRRNRRGQLEDAWKKQADELDERLTAQNKGERDWLRTQLAKCQAECTRLNKIITRRGGPND